MSGRPSLEDIQKMSVNEVHAYIMHLFDEGERIEKDFAYLKSSYGSDMETMANQATAAVTELSAISSRVQDDFFYLGLFYSVSRLKFLRLTLLE